MPALNCKLSGQHSGGPNALSDQSLVRIRAPISPPPASQGMRSFVKAWAAASSVWAAAPLRAPTILSMAPSRLRERSAFATYPAAPTAVDCLLVISGVVLADDEDCGIRKFAADNSCRINAVHLRHGDVHQNNVWPLSASHLHGFFAVAGFTTDRPFGARKQQ